MTAPLDFQQQIQEDLGRVSAWVSRTRVVDRVERIPGDASTRRYYRVLTGGRDARSFIAMCMEPFAELNHRRDTLPFLTVQKHLRDAGVDVPVVADVEETQGLILLEDLGDVTLLRHLQEVSNADVERHLYERVIDSLVRLQFHASPRQKPVPGFEPYRLRFDLEKLMWEVNFTIEHFYKLHLKREITAGDEATMRGAFEEICRTLADEPTVLTHRDFHSRNLMVRGERLVMIDFQDARLGPAQYDLASLLKDSYYQLEEGQVDRLIDYYVTRWEGVSGERLQRDHFRTIFDLMHIQRNFKAIGSFASFLNRRGNPTYLKYIGNTFENIRRALLKYPKYSGLREVLFHYYYF
jgi:aminoglycoside/choline kinase family phosphotransferase